MRTSLMIAALLLASHSSPGSAQEAFNLQIPLGLKAMKIPADNPLTQAKIDLGKQLYFDKRLSVDDTVACASLSQRVCR